jgi:plastocyanin
MKTIHALAICTLMLSAPAYAEDSQISIKDHLFTPSTLTISAGTKVTWTNHDQDPHTVVESGAPKPFHSSALDTNDTFSYTFTEPGTYKYFCTLHPTMAGKVVVTAVK